MNYTLNQLRIFLQVVRQGSITKAAEDLHLSQPAVSIQVRNLQEQFDIPLLEVVNKKVYITDFGQEIAAAAERMLAEVELIEARMQAYKGRLVGKLKISSVSTGKYIAPYFLSDFISQHPAIELFLDVTNKAQVIQSLEKNEVDFALVSVLPEHLSFEKVELMQNKLYLVGTPDMVKAAGKADKKLFERIPLIYREQGSGTRYTVERFFVKHKLSVTKKLELTSNEAVKQAVISGLGFSIMPLIGIKNELDSGQLQILPVRGFPIRSTWTLIWLRNKRHSPVARAFLSYIRSEKQRIINARFNWVDMN